MSVGFDSFRVGFDSTANTEAGGNVNFFIADFNGNGKTGGILDFFTVGFAVVGVWSRLDLIISPFACLLGFAPLLCKADVIWKMPELFAVEYVCSLQALPLLLGFASADRGCVIVDGHNRGVS